LLVFPMAGTRLRMIAQIAPEEGATAPSVDWLQRISDDRAGPGITIRRAHWLTVFEVHHGQVPAYRSGRVFLAGDAAHVHSPAGGQGMNTGMQDAFNLAWKLARADGTASGALLDSYHAERHPVAAQVIRFSTRLTEAGVLRGTVSQWLRNNLAHAATALAPVRHAMADLTEETGLAYPDSPLVLPGRVSGRLRAGDHLPDVPGTGLRAAIVHHTGHVLVTVTGPDGAVPQAATTLPGVRQVVVAAGRNLADARRAAADAGGDTGRYDEVLTDSDGLVAQRYALARGGRVMVRPDGYVGYVSALDDAAAPAAYAEILRG